MIRGELPASINTRTGIGPPGEQPVTTTGSDEQSALTPGLMTDATRLSLQLPPRKALSLYWCVQPFKRG